LRRGPWRADEDLRLLKFISHHNGSKKWSEIAKHFEGRTENALKNRFTLIIEKERKSSRTRNKSERELVTDYLERHYLNQLT
jgi:hypothetical protein